MSLNFPKLSKGIAFDEVEYFQKEKDLDPDKITKEINIKNSFGLFWSPIGERIDLDVFVNLRKKVLKNLVEYKKKLQGNLTKRDLDFVLGKDLFETFENYLVPAMASELELWYFLNVRVFPDLLIKRWKKNNTEINKERFFSSNRNYCGTLWWRFYIFKDKSNNRFPYWIIDGLSEDTFVGILERTELRGYPNVAVELAKKALEIQESNKPSLTSLLIRKMLVVFRTKALVFDMNYLSLESNKIRDLVEESFQIATLSIEQEQQTK